MDPWYEILHEERRYCEQQRGQQRRHMVEIVCVSLSSTSMDEDDDVCGYSDATSVSSITLVSTFDEDDIVTVDELTNKIVEETSVEKRCSNTMSSEEDSRQLLAQNSTCMIVHKLSLDDEYEGSSALSGAAEWIAHGDAYAISASFQKAELAYQRAVSCSEGLELARAYTGLGSVYVAIGDIASALQCRDLADAELTKVDKSARSVLPLLRDELSFRSFPEDELNELFRRVATVD